MVYVKRTEDFLAHHGIKGQKWGVKNGPPYPLGYNDHNTAEKRANPKGKLDNYADNKVGSSKKAGMMEAVIVDLAVLAAYYGLATLAVKAADKRRTKQFEDEYYGQRKINTLKDAPKIDPSSMSMNDHMSKINPDYPDPGSVQNCMFCTTAMAMRMKGYDVQAETCPDGWSNENLKTTWSEYQTEKPKSRNTTELKKYLESQGDGSYGNLTVYWSLGGGHSMFYHVDNGEVKIYDTQANKVRNIRDLSGAINVRRTEVTRLDNVEPTDMVLGCVKPREEKKS